MIQFELPKNQSSIIKVIGVGGGGSNAVNYMYRLGIQNVDFIICNTDAQALEKSEVPNKIQLGPALTAGLGAGANPEVGMKASEESTEDINRMLQVNTKMAFITAGMGGGTGTGGAPVVAKICRELGILTVGIVTLPFKTEGHRRIKQAQEGIARMREYVDTILIISNDKVRQQFGSLPFTKAFAKADDILATAAKCITDVINTTGQINVDFADVCTVMRNGGVAILGNAEVAGEDRASKAVEEALSSPLLNDNEIKGAKWILLNITSSEGEFEHTMDEAELIQTYVQEQAGENCDVILGMGHDPALGDKIGVTIIATGFHHKDIDQIQKEEADKSKVVHELTPATDNVTVLNLDNTPVETAVNNKEESTASFAELTPFQRMLKEQEEQKSLFEFQLRSDNNEPVVAPTIPAALEPLDLTPTLKEDTPASNINDLFAPTSVPNTAQPNTSPEPASPLSFQLSQNTPTVEQPTRRLSEIEEEEQRRFEEQKRALEERAERLRRMSFNYLNNEASEDLENVPAYLRRQQELKDDQQGVQSQMSSGTSVKPKEEAKKTNSILQTLNSFLEGKKPD